MWQREGEEKRKFESPHSLVHQLTWSSSVSDDAAAAVVADKWTPPWAAPHPWVSRARDNSV